MKERDTRDVLRLMFANLAMAVIALIVIAVLIGTVVWYVETRWGHNAVGWVFAFVAAVATIAIGWLLAGRSFAGGAKTATDAVSHSVDMYGAGFEYLVAGQKALTAAASAEGYAAKAHAAQANADAQIRVLDYKAELEMRKQEALPAPEPVRSAPWEQRQLPNPDNDGNVVNGRFRKMH